MPEPDPQPGTLVRLVRERRAALEAAEHLDLPEASTPAADALEEVVGGERRAEQESQREGISKLGWEATSMGLGALICGGVSASHTGTIVGGIIGYAWGRRKWRQANPPD
jgi:hypothetical protein